ncbi:MAG: aminotransferase class III-fold pyridoxal phosphate-dependent enzyme [Gammaproteobacteria bacterium]|nr:aminotransferase class III-fold pyridoxal phosphate-dependent enzyme [Gammaproteobacteria bacterium]
MLALERRRGTRGPSRRTRRPVAAILVNPLDQSPLRTTQALSAEMAAAISAARDRHGLRIIVDDVRHGLRLHAEGSHRRLGIDAPDLLCLGKAIGNGHATSALLGRADLKASAAKVPFTASHVFGAVAMRAGIATLDVYQRDGVLARLESLGEQLRDGFIRRRPWRDRTSRSRGRRPCPRCASRGPGDPPSAAGSPSRRPGGAPCSIRP